METPDQITIPETISPAIASTLIEVKWQITIEITVALVVITSPRESAAVASITFESILFPSLLLKNAIHNFTRIDKIRIINGTGSNVISSGCIIFEIELLKKVKPTSITRNETIRAAIYSILPWPKGCSASAGFPAIFTPTKLIIEEAASDKLLKASAVTARELKIRPMASFTEKSRTLQKIPTTLASIP